MELPSTRQNDELRWMFDQSRWRILSILEDALLLTQIDVNGLNLQPAPISIHAAICHAIAAAAEFAKGAEVDIQPPAPNFEMLFAAECLLVRAFQALLETAIKFCSRGASVRVSCAATPESIHLDIHSHGQTIPPVALENFFDPFAIGEASTPGGPLGLGPSVARRILSLYSASVDVANLDPPGVAFSISFRKPVAAHPPISCRNSAAQQRVS